jgi:hypothetical protein
VSPVVATAEQQILQTVEAIGDNVVRSTKATAASLLMFGPPVVGISPGAFVTQRASLGSAALNYCSAWSIVAARSAHAPEYKLCRARR